MFVMLNIIIQVYNNIVYCQQKNSNLLKKLFPSLNNLIYFDYMNKHADKIRQLLKKHNMKQSEFAKSVGMLPSTFSMRLKSPDLGTVEMVCNYFDMRLSDFFSEPGDGNAVFLSEDHRKFHDLFMQFPRDLQLKAIDVLTNCLEFYVTGKLNGKNT